MRSALFGVVVACALVLPAHGRIGQSSPPAWAMNASVIEACSCTMFCQCYFNPRPTEHTSAAEHAGHGKGHFCKFNNVYKINKGHHGATNLDGAKFWIASDLGDDFSKGEMDWAVLYFDKSLTPAQREAIGVVAGKLFPVKWKSFKTEEATIDKWQFDKDGAHALLDGGKTAEVKLHRFKGLTDEPVVMRNLPYWGAKRNDGFVMMPNEKEAYRLGPKAYEYKGTNGFMLTIDIDADSAPAKAKTTM